MNYNLRLIHKVNKTVNFPPAGIKLWWSWHCASL